MEHKVEYTVVPSPDRPGGLDLVKTITGTDSCGNVIVISSSRAPLRLTGGENLPGNIAETSIQFVVFGSILIVSSPTPNPSGFIRFFAWEISDPSSLEPISSESIVFLTEFGQKVRNNITCCDTNKIRMNQQNGCVFLHAPRNSILVGGIAKTETKSFSLQFKTEVNKRGKQTLGDIRINPIKQRKDK